MIFTLFCTVSNYLYYFLLLAFRRKYFLFLRQELLFPIPCSLLLNNFPETVQLFLPVAIVFGLCIYRLCAFLNSVSCHKWVENILSACCWFLGKLSWPELEFWNSLWGLGTGEEQGYRTGPPCYIDWRNSFLGIYFCAP